MILTCSGKVGVSKLGVTLTFLFEGFRGLSKSLQATVEVLLYAFFRVISRHLNFICRRFETWLYIDFLVWGLSLSFQVSSGNSRSTVICFLPGNFPASEFYMSTFRNLALHWLSCLVWGLSRSFQVSSGNSRSTVICFIPGISPASEFYMPTFRNALFHLHRRISMKND